MRVFLVLLATLLIQQPLMAMQAQCDGALNGRSAEEAYADADYVFLAKILFKKKYDYIDVEPIKILKGNVSDKVRLHYEPKSSQDPIIKKLQVQPGDWLFFVNKGTSAIMTIGHCDLVQKPDSEIAKQLLVTSGQNLDEYWAKKMALTTSPKPLYELKPEQNNAPSELKLGETSFKQLIGEDLDKAIRGKSTGGRLGTTFFEDGSYVTGGGAALISGKYKVYDSKVCYGASLQSLDACFYLFVSSDNKYVWQKESAYRAPNPSKPRLVSFTKIDTD